MGDIKMLRNQHRKYESLLHFHLKPDVCLFTLFSSKCTCYTSETDGVMSICLVFMITQMD